MSLVLRVLKDLTDMLPSVKYVPEWMPGAGFKTKARRWRVPTLEMVSAPFMVVKNALVSIPLYFQCNITNKYCPGKWNGWTVGIDILFEEDF